MNTSFGITFDKRRSRQDPVLEIHFLLMMLPSLIFFPIVLESASSADTISTAKSLTDGETLVSSGKTFELGFFSPGKSTYRYLGIWYKITPNSVVWVANRNNPLTDLDGELTISKNGNLVLLNRTRTVIWSSNVSGVIPSDPVALLLDSGNLVLTNSDSMMGTEHYLWQSFDYPSDTILAGMKHGWDLNTGHERYLVSWKSVDDPSPGNFTYRMDISHGLPEFVLVMGSTRKLYRSGTWNGMRFTGQIVPMDNVFKNIIVINENESYYMFEPIVDSVVTRLTLKQSGQPHRLILQHGNTEWSIMYSVPYEQCDEYGHCGANAICRINGNPICACLEGFTPVSQEEWQVLNWSRGCKNITPWDCQKEEGFVKVPGVKLPDLLEFKLNKSMSLKECKRECLNNCSCKALANSDISNGGSGCLMWFGNLIDVRELRVKGSEQDMYLRLSASKMKLILDASKKKRQMIILVVSTFLGVFFLGLVLCCLRFWKSRRMIKGNNEDENIDVPLFSFATIATATNNFSEAQLIGAGGFGPVYKGNLLTGQEVAVKRLSKNSGQGLKEFKNEVELIAKLQHRNLVALLGCCIQGEERMLIYEYMPNKSLDRFIFDYKRRITLPWKKHFDIVKGIARGLLYLQQDSKLHIVHRDLKASNILLDNNLNPKISDFGLARIFGDDETEARTRRVIGTFGYMSPEYAIDGKFSVKSDIFSFGVLLLEIVSGKRNRSFHHPNHHHNLLGHAWLLWSEGKALDLMDVCFKDSYVESQVLRCIHIALLCIQKFPHDRPTMSYVVFMLENEEALPSDRPRQPGFFVERADSTSEGSMSRSEEFNSENMLTITVPNVR